jgi:hypothetical protein
MTGTKPMIEEFVLKDAQAFDKMMNNETRLEQCLI